MRYLLDTDTVSWLMRQKGDRAIVERLDAVAGEIAISSITLGELHYDANISSKADYYRVEIATILAVLPVLPFDEPAAEHWGYIRADLKRQGTPIGAFDPMIAGHARSLGLTLVTHNTRHHGLVPGLIIEDWIE